MVSFDCRLELEFLVVNKILEVVQVRLKSILSGSLIRHLILLELVEHVRDLPLGETTPSLVTVMRFDGGNIKVPLASMLKVIKIRGTPGRAGGMRGNSKLQSRVLSFVRIRSPSYTWMNTLGWLST